MNKIKTAISFLSYVSKDGPFKNRVYLAGGAVRDMQLGLNPKDIDVVVTGGIDSGIEL
jgi:tRNA nucleotidyltransferase/poly(A) polymerase